MRVFEAIRRDPPGITGTVLTIGSFDGVHLGHRAILREVTRRASACGGVPAVLTFRPHPREYFSPGHAPNLLTSERKKLSLFEEAGVRAVFMLQFDEHLANMDPDDFVEDIMLSRCGTREVVVGHDFRFGRGARGDFAHLEAMAGRLGFTVDQVEPLLIKGERVSSTLIRERVLQGDLDGVEDFLGRKYSVMGEVLRGRGIGAELGFPTANIRPHHSAIPAHGVYAATVLADGSEYLSAVNIGIAPTIRHTDLTIEAFILDFDRDIRDTEIEIVFHKRLRPEAKYPSREELVAQIARDVGNVRAYFAVTR
jgi:riboflavin kinase / FMN adenylyltransferase